MVRMESWVGVGGSEERGRGVETSVSGVAGGEAGSDVSGMGALLGMSKSGYRRSSSAASWSNSVRSCKLNIERKTTWGGALAGVSSSSSGGRKTEATEPWKAMGVQVKAK